MSSTEHTRLLVWDSTFPDSAYAPSALGGLAPPPLDAPSPSPRAPPPQRGIERNSLNLYQLAQNNTCSFETARGFKLDIPKFGAHRLSVLELFIEVLRLLVLEMGLLF